MKVPHSFRVFFLLFAACILSPVYAERSEVSLQDLVENSPLVVVGTLDKVKEHSKDGVDYGEGQIMIHEVLFGKADAKKELRLKWSNPTGLACPRTEHSGAQKQKLIWVFESIKKS